MEALPSHNLANSTLHQALVYHQALVIPRKIWSSSSNGASHETLSPYGGYRALSVGKSMSLRIMTWLDAFAASLGAPMVNSLFPLSTLKTDKIGRAGNRFAVGDDIGRVTIHRIQDGLEISHSFAKVHPADRLPKVPGICGLTWVKMPLSRFWSQDESTNPPPEMYPRGYDAPGSGHYLLKSLPKIDWKPPLYKYVFSFFPLSS